FGGQAAGIAGSWIEAYEFGIDFEDCLPVTSVIVIAKFGLPISNFLLFVAALAAASRILIVGAALQEAGLFADSCGPFSCVLRGAGAGVSFRDLLAMQCTLT